MLLDHEFEVISALVQSQKAQRNAISPISTLPSEVLVLIFKAYRDDDSNTFGYRDRNALARLSDSCTIRGRGNWVAYIKEPSKHLGWMECSRVCQRWRHIIFGTSSLWSDVILDWGPSCLQRFLKYSQSASKIRFLGHYLTPDISRSKQGWSVPSVSDLSRADRISLGAAHQCNLIYFLRQFRFRSTVLNTIELTLTESKSSVSTTDAVPLGLLLDNFPALEFISLRDCLVYWNRPLLPSHSLKSMKIIMNDHELGRRDHAEFFNVTDASKFFRSTPSLEILTLIYCFHPPRHRDTETDKVIELPCLRELDLEEGHGTWCSYFLGRLSLPSESMPRLRLGFYHDFGGSKDNNLIRSHLQRRFHDVDVSTGYLELLNASDSDTRRHWKVHTRVMSSEGVEVPIQSDSGTGTEKHTDLCFKDTHSDVNDNQMLVSYEACRSLPLLFVRVLVIEDADAILWEILAERFPSITSITCLGENAFIHSPMNGNTSSSIPPVRAFPKLEFLKLYWIRLGVETCDGEDASAGLLKWLRMRKEAGVPVERLVLERCRPPDTWLSAARDFVEHVEVAEKKTWGY